MIRFSRWFAKTLWTLLAVLLVVLAIVVQVGRELSPQLGSFRPDLERYLSAQLELPVTVAALDVSWQGLTPRLHLRDLVAQAPDGSPALQAAVFTVELDLAASLLHRQLYWRQGVLADVDLVLDQHPDGRWALHGQTLQPRTDVDFDVSGLLRMLSYAGAISLDNINIHFRFLTGRQSDFAFTSVQLDNDGDFQRLTASLTLPEQPEVLTLVAERHGSLLRRPTRMEGYLRIRQLPLQKSALISEQLADSALMQGTLDLALWLHSGTDSELQLQGDINIDWQAAAGVPRRLHSDLRGVIRNGDQWQLGLVNLQTDWRSGSSPALQGVLHGRFSSEQLELQLARLELAPWYQLLQTEGAIRGRLAEILEKVQPAGALTRLHLRVPLQAPDHTLLRANLEQVAVDSWVGAPALRQVDGYLQADARGGRVDLDSRAGFSMHYPTVYSGPMVFDEARGQVAWQLRKADNAVFVNSGRLQLRRGDSRASGYFYLRTPWLRHSEPGELYLQLGLVNTPATDYAMYVPFLVDEGTRNWLAASIRGGRIASAGFIYRGYFDYGRDHGRTVQLQADIREGQLQFHPDWPGLTDVAATLSLSDGQTRVDASTGKLLGTDLQDTTVLLGRNPAGSGHLLNITGSVTGPAGHGLDMLRQTPLRQWIGATFDRWHLQGDLQAAVDLAVPLHSGAAGARQRVQVSLPDTTLLMEDLGLQVDNLRGQIRYDSASGLSATALEGTLWGQPLRATLTPPAAAGDTFLDVKGAAAVTDIATWLRRPELMFASGLLPYQLRVTIPRQSSGRGVSVAVTSDLQGVAVGLPEPYGKVPEARRKLAVAVDLSAALRRYRIDYDQVLRALFEQAPQQPLRGAVTLNTPLPAQVAAGIRVSGALPEADLPAWLPLLGEYQHFREILAASAADPDTAAAATDPVFSVELAVGELQAGGQRWQDVQIQARQQATGWTVEVENPQLRAAIDVFADGSVPVAALEYLHLPAPAEELPAPALAEGEPPVAPDPAWRHLLDDVSPAQFFPIDVRVDALKVGDKDFGRWSFHLRTAPDEVRFESLRGDARGLRVDGGTDAGSGALLRWRDDGQSSQSLFSGSIGGRDFGKVLQRWGLADVFEAERAHFPMALYWPGSPVAIRLATLTGSVDVSLRKGRFNASGGSGSSALLRLMGLFNFDSWSRRLKLDFSDTFRNGTAFDEIDGSLSFQEGIVYLQQPMEVVTPSARLLMAGTIDVVREEMDTSLVATLPVGGNLTMAAVFAGGLPAAAGVYVISKLFKNQVDKVASVSYRMQGSWDDPVLSFDKLFDSKAASRAGAKAAEQLQEEDAAPPAASPSAPTEPVPGSEASAP